MHIITELSTPKGDSQINMNSRDTSMVDFDDASGNKPSGNGANNGNNDASLSHSFSQMNVDETNELDPQPRLSGRQRSRSTLIFDDDDEIPPYSDHQEHSSANISDSDMDSNTSGNDSDVYMQEGTPNHPDMSHGQDQHQQQMQQQQMQQQQMQQQQQQQMQQQQMQQQQNVPSQQPTPENVMVPVDITWQQGGQKAYVTGSFTGWRKMIGLVPVPGQPGVMHVKLQLPPGTHRFRFIVDNELRFSDYLPTATDQMGNFVNYLEVVAPTQQVPQQQPDVTNRGTINSGMGNEATASQNAAGAGDARSPIYKEQQQGRPQAGGDRKEPMSARSRIALEIESEPDDMGNGFSRFKGEALLTPKVEYTQDIPAVFTDPTVMEQYYLTLDQQQNNHQNMAWLTPPQLPPHLENVILNSYSNSQGQNNENTSGALPIPNHVILNHLATSSIKHNTLCVASIVRYKQKYVTQILYAPLQ